jgi:2-(1,2-epoxy-1,2-dihydrophenyl)acetyl-CoA isomerase
VSGDGTVRLERRGPLAVVVLDRPAARNALTVPMRAQAIEAVAAADADDAVAAIAITGAGEHFCGGGDVASMPEVRDRWDGRARTRTAQALTTALRDAGKPTVAIARGAVAGLGVSVFAVCDVRLAAEDARFRAAFPGVGLVPDGGLMHALPRLVGAGRARDFLLLDEPLAAADAHAWGLVSRVAPGAALDALADEIAARWAGLPRHALALTKAGLRMGGEASWDAALEFERTAQGALIDDPEARARVQAFLERRRGA